MLKNKRIVFAISFVTFLISYFVLFSIVTFNGAGVQPEAFFVSISHFSYDPSVAIHAFYNISPQVIMVLLILTMAYWFIYHSMSDKCSLQKIVFYLVMILLCFTICLSILAHLNGAEESSIIGVSYLLNILTFKNYAMSFLLLILMVYPILRIKNKHINHH